MGLITNFEKDNPAFAIIDSASKRWKVFMFKDGYTTATRQGNGELPNYFRERVPVLSISDADLEKYGIGADLRLIEEVSVIGTLPLDNFLIELEKVGLLVERPAQ